jgi:Uma2 family endonuclease
VAMSKTNLAHQEKLYTAEEYLALERTSDEKHEFLDGRIVPLHEEFEITAMAGASRRHNLINGNLFGEIRNQLKGKDCEVYINDMRVQLNPNRYGYSDVVVACETPEFIDDKFDTLLNPIVVIEVLSSSTRFRDKTEKLEDFRKLESLKECLLIEQDKIFIEHYIKQTPNQWLLRIYENSEELVNLESIGCEIKVAEIYLQVRFE